tara:strand:+ start:617 stop:838 length:222 start_codon:yes stop_codon:yes gene_type:complete
MNKMTKRFHKCDDSCKHPDEKPKVTKPKITKPKKLDEWDIYLGRIVDLLNIKKDNRSLGILMECLRNMENRDK